MKSYQSSKAKRHPWEGVLRKSCSENLQKIPRKTSVTELIFSTSTSLQVGKYAEYHISSNNMVINNKNLCFIFISKDKMTRF